MSTEDSAAVNRVALRLPQFWRNNVQLWIRQCDSAFTLSNITSDDTKYAALVSSLDSETLSHVSDIVLSPPAADKYKALSDRLIAEFTDSEHQKIKKLLTDLQLGDNKPSYLLRKMKELSAGQLQDEFLKTLWLQRLPSQIQTVLSVSTEGLDQLAVIADKVAEIALPIAVCSTEAVPIASTSELQKLTEQVADLTLQVARLSRSRSRDFNASRNFSRTRSRSAKRNSDICYYHRRFREKARKCTPPCKFSRSSCDTQNSDSGN